MTEPMEGANKYKNDIEYLRRLKDAKDKKNEELKAINAEIEQYERRIIEQMELDGLDTLSVRGIGTAFITVKDYPQVTDMEQFVKWCYENNRADMLQKRISSTAYNQFVQAENVMPDGTNTYSKATLNFRRS